MLPFQKTARRLMAALALLSLLVICGLPLLAWAGDPCMAFAPTMTREAQSVHGPDAPVPMFMGQARQESSCRANVTAWDNGRGLMQFMDGTGTMVSRLFPELGPPNPYDPRWAIRAQQRFDGWLYKRVKGKDDCQRWGAALKSYNAGLGYVQQAQAKSHDPQTWFGVTEYIPTRQSARNHEDSRTYPRKILQRHQLRYRSLGRVVCAGLTGA